MSNEYGLKDYFKLLFDKYTNINTILITDSESALVFCESKKEMNKSAIEKLKTSLTFLISSAYDQLLKTEKEKIKYMTTFFDTQLLMQAKLTSFLIIHILANAEDTNIEVLKNIIEEISAGFASSQIEGIFNNN